MKPIPIDVADYSFIAGALLSIDFERRELFAARVYAALGAIPDPGPGDVDRAVRCALVGLWEPIPDELACRAPAPLRGRAKATAGRA